jgi:hypothetical protein
MSRYLVVISLILFVSFTLLQASTVEKEVKESYDLNFGAELSIKNVNGKIQVESWGED